MDNSNRDGWTLRGWALASLSLNAALIREISGGADDVAERIINNALSHLNSMTVQAPASPEFADGIRMMFEEARKAVENVRPVTVN